MNLDEIAKKLGGLGVPGVILVILAITSAGSNAAIVATLTSIGGPFGILGGIGLLGLTSLIGDAASTYGLEAIIKAIYSERKKTESLRLLLKEVQDLPISDELKTKLTEHLNSETTETEVVEEPKTVEIVDEDEAVVVES
ncbi:MAG: hypothetical protein EAZ87_12990 [Nostocales cyanobacterium]|nr:MAG: hypothetical protein EAZ87_12990 [Nostocales cyanobacterium]